MKVHPWTLLGFVNRLMKNRASGRDPALCGFCKCSHMTAYVALSKTPHALADGLMLAFQYPVDLRNYVIGC
jgi:hypothetical protein